VHLPGLISQLNPKAEVYVSLSGIRKKTDYTKNINFSENRIRINKTEF